uniref:Uncharacterized protein n=1 Tax=Plectus sambesii TaxID=2011161 RepID=A0A914V4Y0_9BILA
MDRQKLVFLFADMTHSGAVRHKREDSILSTCIILPFVGQLKTWLSDFLTQNESMIATEVARNYMIKQVLKLIYSLVDFGYYGDTDDIQKLLHPMCCLMDGRNDKPFVIQQEAVISSDIQDEVKRYCASERFRKTAENEVMALAKYQAMKVIELFFNFRFNTRLTRFIIRFRNVIESGGSDPVAPFADDDTQVSEFSENQSLRRVALKAINDLFKETAYFGKEFVDILLDFLQYEQEKVVTEALFLLTQYYSAFEDLFRKCIDAQ